MTSYTMNYDIKRGIWYLMTWSTVTLHDMTRDVVRHDVTWQDVTWHNILHITRQYILWHNKTDDMKSRESSSKIHFVVDVTSSFSSWSYSVHSRGFASVKIIKLRFQNKSVFVLENARKLIFEMSSVERPRRHYVS